MIDFILTALFFAAFLLPVFLTVSGRLRKRWSVPLLIIFIVLPPILISVAGMVFYPYQMWSGTFIGSLATAYFLGLTFSIVIAPIFWYSYHHAKGFKTFGLLFASAFDPRFNPNQRYRGPVGKLAKNKILTGTKPATGSKKFVALRDRMLRDIQNMGKGKR